MNTESLLLGTVGVCALFVFLGILKRFMMPPDDDKNKGNGNNNRSNNNRRG